MWAFLQCGEQGYTLAALCGLLLLQGTGSRARELTGGGSEAQLLCRVGSWTSGQIVSPALAAAVSCTRAAGEALPFGGFHLVLSWPAPSFLHVGLPHVHFSKSPWAAPLSL